MGKSMVDHVEEVFLRLYELDSFKELLDFDPIEGLIRIRDLQAAQMIRDAAPVGSPLTENGLEKIRRALMFVLRRYRFKKGDENDD